MTRANEKSMDNQKKASDIKTKPIGNQWKAEEVDKE